MGKRKIMTITRARARAGKSHLTILTYVWSLFMSQDSPYRVNASFTSKSKSRAAPTKLYSKWSIWWWWWWGGMPGKE